MADVSVANYTEQGGAKTVIGGEIDVTGTLKKASVAVTATAAELNALHSQAAVAADFAKLHAITVAAAVINKLVQSPTAGIAITAGVVAFTGSTSFNTGLAAVVAREATPVSDPSVTNGMYVTAAPGTTTGYIIVNSWKPTAANNVEPVAGTALVTVNWVAVGPS